MGQSIVKNPRRIFSQQGGSGGVSIPTVTDYASLPDPTTVSGEFRWVSTSTGIYLVGLYYSDGITWSASEANDITVVANYSALPAANTVSGQFYWCSAAQGTSWLPGSLGGTYYNSGMYYSNGISWEFLNVPYNATQSEVNTGTNDDKFITPLTFTNASKWGTVGTIKGTLAATSGLIPTANGTLNTIAGSNDFTNDGTDFIAKPTTTIKHQIGTTSTNAMYRLDSVGFRIGTIATVGTTNTAIFEVDNTIKFLGSNTKLGIGANASLTSGVENIGIGVDANKSITTGRYNIAIGNYANQDTVVSDSNISIGLSANKRTTASGNIAIGTESLFTNTTGASNVAIGNSALSFGTTSTNSVAVGTFAGYSNNSSLLTSVGYQSAYLNNSGFANTSVGSTALYSNVSGGQNVALGRQALFYALGNANIGLGYNAGVNETGSNSLYIHNGLGVTTEANGKTRSIIYGQMSAALNSQQLTVNGGFRVQTTETSTDTAIRVDTVGFRIGTVATVGTTNTAKFEVDGAALIGASNNKFGLTALNSLTSGVGNNGFGFATMYPLSTGSYNNSFGHNSQRLLSTGSSNNSFGQNSLYYNVSGGYNAAFGGSALNSVLGSFNIGVGWGAGQYETGSNSLYIHNSLGVSSEANGKTRSIIYGQMDSTLTSQLLTINGGFRVQTSETSTDTAIRVDTVGMRVGTIATIGTANTAKFEIDGAAKIGTLNTNFGLTSLNALTTGTDNTAFGSSALSLNSIGLGNAAFGTWALKVNTSSFNSAFGGYALSTSTTSTRNSAFGYEALLNSNASDNTAIGYLSQRSNTSGTFNTSIGSYSLRTNSTGLRNTVVGGYAGNSATGSDNIGIGSESIAYGGSFARTIGIGTECFLYGKGNDCVALGYQSQKGTGSSTSAAINNVSLGNYSLLNNLSGDSNIAIGHKAAQYETGSNALYIHNSLGVTTEANGKTRSIIYGQMSAALSSQLLTVNGGFRVQTTETSTDTAIRVDTVGLKIGTVADVGTANTVPLEILTSTANDKIRLGRNLFGGNVDGGVPQGGLLFSRTDGSYGASCGITTYNYMLDLIGRNGVKLFDSAFMSTVDSEKASFDWAAGGVDVSLNVGVGAKLNTIGANNAMRIYDRTINGSGGASAYIQSTRTGYTGTNVATTLVLKNNSTTSSGTLTKNGLVVSLDTTTGVNIGMVTNAKLNAFGHTITSDYYLTTPPTATIDIIGSETTQSSLRIRSGVAPTSPNDGDIWFDGTDLKMRIGGVTKTFTLV